MSTHELPLTPYQQERAEDLAEQLLLTQFGPRGVRGFSDAYGRVEDTARRFSLEAPDHHPYDDMAEAETAHSVAEHVARPAGAALLQGAADHIHTPLIVTGKQAAFEIAATARARQADIRDTRIIMAHMRNPDGRYPDQEQ